jgi:hypothetical protein
MEMTVGELKVMLAEWPDDFELTFGANWGSPVGMPYEFFRLKQRGEKHLELELQDKYDEEEWLERQRRQS